MDTFVDLAVKSLHGDGSLISQTKRISYTNLVSDLVVILKIIMKNIIFLDSNT